MKRIMFAFGALALAGCAPSAEQNAAANEAVESNAADNAGAGGNVLERVLTMTDRERNLVFIRAILDAGLKCDGVEKSTRLPDIDGKPLWRADCKGGGSHMISITPDGTANIVSRSDV